MNPPDWAMKEAKNFKCSCTDVVVRLGDSASVVYPEIDLLKLAAALTTAYERGYERGKADHIADAGKMVRAAEAKGWRGAADASGNPDYAPGADRWELANCFDNEADKLDPPKDKGHE